MKLQNKMMSFILFFVFTIGFSMFYSGCSSNLSPLGPTATEKSEKSDLKILTFGNALPVLNKVISTSEFIEREKGGKLCLKYEIENVDIDIKLTIHKNSIPEAAEFLMSIDDEQFLGNLDVTFGPHGMQFSEPADLDITVKGLNLTGLNPDKIDVYYDNQETGQWEIMECEKIKIDAKKGQIEVIKAKLPHFSRYALAHSE